MCDVFSILKNIRMRNVDRVIIVTLRQVKFHQLKVIMPRNIDILVITESKLNNTFPMAEFFINGISCIEKVEIGMEMGF